MKIIIKAKNAMKEEDLKLEETKLSDKFGCRVIILPSYLSDFVVIE